MNSIPVHPQPTHYLYINLKNIENKIENCVPRLNIESAEAELQKTANTAVDLLMQTGNFAGGARRAQLIEIFCNATNDGPESISSWTSDDVPSEI